MRAIVVPMLVLSVTAGCAGRIPDSGAGVGFDDYSTYQQAGQGQSQLPTASGTSEGAAVAAEASAALGLAPSAQSTSAMPAPMNAMNTGAANTTAPAAPAGNSASLSDEQNFQAVSGRETIQSDAERIAANRAQYQVIQPTDLPPRPGGTGASIVSFALATNNAVGQPLYNRSSIGAKARFDRGCAKYASSDQAQQAFLDAGGPERDRQGLDPDGDGFACYWNPAPFRAARAGAPEQITQYVDVETPGES